MTPYKETKNGIRYFGQYINERKNRMRGGYKKRGRK